MPRPHSGVQPSVGDLIDALQARLPAGFPEAESRRAARLTRGDETLDSRATTTVVAPRVGPAHVITAWVFAVFTLGYFLPWAIAATRQKSNALAIGLLNFFVGWTVIGWIAAMVMSVQTEPAQVTNVAYAVAPVVHVGPHAAPAGWCPDQFGTRRYWDGQRWTGHTAP